MFACILLNLMFLFNNQSKNGKEINFYIGHFKKYIKKGISKSVTFSSILSRTNVRIE